MLLRASFIAIATVCALFLCAPRAHAQRLGKKYFAYYDSTVYYQAHGDFVKAAKYMAKMKRRGSRVTAGWDNYELARMRAVAGDERAALRAMRRAVRHRFVAVDLMKTNEDLQPLWSEDAYVRLQSRAEKRAKKMQNKRNDAWTSLLECLGEQRSSMEVAFSVVNRDSIANSDSLRVAMQSFYQEHGKLVESYIDQYGWPKTKEIGKQGSDILFDVLKDQPFEVRQKYYKVIKRAAFTDPNVRQHKAMYVDRLRLDQGKKQKYGTQYGFDESKQTFYLYPVVNPLRLDARRLRVGMEPMERWQKSINLVVNF